MNSEHVFIGTFIHSKSLSELEIINGFMVVNNGKIVKFAPTSELEDWMVQDNCGPITTLSPTQFVMPGFIDCHTHAPQMPNIGLGLDMPLMKWLEKYTFPLEAEYKDPVFAEHVYKKVVRRMLQNGTTFANYFATNHASSSFILALEAQKQGQRALIGKTSSNCCVPDYYVENTEESLKDNVEFAEKVLSLNDDLIQPIISPRFAISCDDILMKGLAKIAKKYDLNIQTHISESIDEVKYIVDKHKKTYSEVYHETGLLTEKTILAHAVHLDDSEINLIASCKTSIAHCPASNTCLSSGFCDVKRILAGNIKVGLGTDVSGGNKSSILSAIRDTLNVSHNLEFAKKQDIKGTGKVNESKLNLEYKPLNYKEAFYLATLGGSETLGKDKVIGNFVEGKDFDALIVDIDGGPIDVFDLPEKLWNTSETELTLLQKFLYVGDDRNIKEVYVKGRQVK